ncbi:MAG: YoaP domain-containing protein [Chloroflexota bacterium]
MPDIVQKVGDQLKVPVNIIHMNSAAAAQASPCPYGSLGYFYNGELLTYRPTGTEKLLELLKPKL